jgi:hypothetical protein
LCRAKLRKSSKEDHDERKALTLRMKQLQSDFDEQCRRELAAFDASHPSGEERSFEDQVAARVARKQLERQRQASRVLEKRLAADGVDASELKPSLALGDAGAARIEALTHTSAAPAAMASALGVIRDEAPRWDKSGTAARRKRSAMHVFGELAGGEASVDAAVMPAPHLSAEAPSSARDDEDDEDMGEVLQR